MQYGTGILEQVIGGQKLEIDGNNATLSADVPEKVVHESYGRTEDIIYTNPVDLLKLSAQPSFSLIRFGKVKNFIDGVYAAVEKRIHEKGHKLSRADFLATLEGLVQGDAKTYVSAARKLDTKNEPSMTIPQGFYDWHPSLREAYSQIKILAKRPEFFLGKEDDARLNGEVMVEILKNIDRSEGLKKCYESLLDFYSKITGPLKERGHVLFPSAELPDQEFFKQLSFETQSDLPAGLGKVLVEAIKSGRVKIEPDENSGLYLKQMYEIVPLVLRDSVEFQKFLVNDKYKEILENEFISQWAGTRHTHVGHTPFDEVMCGCCLDFSQPISISPDIKVEPFASSYQRMKWSLSHLERYITLYLPEVLDRKRLTNEVMGRNKTIGEEFEDMKLLLTGLEAISKDSLHIQYPGDSKAREAVEEALDWLGNIRNDSDINRNMAIFVPIIRTTDGSRQVSYINAGFKTIDVDVAYKDKPKITMDGKENPRLRYEFESKKYKFPVLVHREVRIPYEKLINDRKLREMLKTSFKESELDDLVLRLEQ